MNEDQALALKDLNSMIDRWGNEPIRISEEWFRHDGKILKVWNGELVDAWDEADAPVVFVRAKDLTKLQG